MTSPSPQPKLQFFTDAGDPLVGGKLYSYAAGTTTPLATYVDYAGISTNTNPVILNSRGEANVWLGTAPYKLVLKDANDVEIWTVDNINQPDAATQNAVLTALAASGGSALIGFIQAGSGAVAMTAQTKMRQRIDGIDFGIAPGNTASQNNTGFAAAIAYLKSVGGGYLHLPVGQIDISTPIQFTADNINIVGGGWAQITDGGGTKLNYTATTGPVFRSDDQTAATRFRCGIYNLNVRAYSLSAAGENIIVDWKSMQFGTLSNLFLQGPNIANSVGISMRAHISGGTQTTECTYNLVDNCYVGLVDFGIRIRGGANTNRIFGGRYQSSVATTGHGILLNGSTGIDAVSNNSIISAGFEFPGNVNFGVQVGANVDGTFISGCRFEGLNVAVYMAANATNTTLVGNYYSSNTTNVLTDAAATRTLEVEQGGVRFPNESLGDNTLLDWYETGTFTPTLTGGTTAPSAVTYVTQVGKFTRLGRLVTFELFLDWSAITGGSGDLTIAGLPYTVANDVYNPVATIFDTPTITHTGQLNAVMVANTKTIILYSSGTGYIAIEPAGTITISGSYFV